MHSKQQLGVSPVDRAIGRRMAARGQAAIRRLALPLAASVPAMCVSLPASAGVPAELDLGNAAGYTIVSLGSGDTFKINSGPIAGNVLVGNGVKVDTSGGNSGRINGTISYDGTVQTSAFSGLQNAPSAGQFTAVDGSFIAGALSSAKAVSAYADGLIATQTFGDIKNGATQITGNGGLNVIDVKSFQNAVLTLNGSANDYFVINVAGDFSTNKAMVLTGGVTANRVLFNLLGSKGNIFQTSGGNALFGTFLATNGGDFQFSNLNLTGSLINTAGNMKFVSGSTMVGATLVSAVPEPSTYALMLAGLCAVIYVSRRRGRGDD